MPALRIFAKGVQLNLEKPYQVPLIKELLAEVRASPHAGNEERSRRVFSVSLGLRCLGLRVCSTL